MTLAPLTIRGFARQFGWRGHGRSAPGRCQTGARLPVPQAQTPCRPGYGDQGVFPEIHIPGSRLWAQGSAATGAKGASYGTSRGSGPPQYYRDELVQLADEGAGLWPQPRAAEVSEAWLNEAARQRQAIEAMGSAQHPSEPPEGIPEKGSFLKRSTCEIWVDGTLVELKGRADGPFRFMEILCDAHPHVAEGARVETRSWSCPIRAARIVTILLPAGTETRRIHRNWWGLAGWHKQQE